MLVTDSLWIIAALSLAAAGVSGILWRSGRKGGSLPGCGAQSGCDAVQKSRWARVGGMPVAVLGLGVYLLLLVAAIVRIYGVGEALSGSVLAVAAIFAGGGAVWFTLLQLVVIRRLCTFCMLLHTLGGSACVLAFVHLSASKAPALGMLPICVGIGGVLALAILQTVLSPKAYATIAASELGVADAAEPRKPIPTHVPASPHDTPAVLPLSLVLVGRKVVLSLDDWPILGSRNAARAIAVMFDVTCEECRHLYRLLQQTVVQHPRDLAFVMLPVPMHPACNPTARGKLSEDVNACEFAKLYLAMWQTAPKAFPEFDRWLMAARRPPAFTDARNKAQRAAVSTTFSFALLDSRIQSRVNHAVDMYRMLRVDILPQILMSDRMIVGRMDSLKELHAVIGLEPLESVNNRPSTTNNTL